MKIKTTTPIRELVAQLPPGTKTAADDAVGKTLKECITALREPIEGTNLFSTEVRHALALEITDAMAQIIQARIPKNARGLPNKRIGLEQEWEEKREAKAQAEAERRELQSIKRLALEMKEAVETFTKRATEAAAIEPVGMPPDNEARHRRLDPALVPLYNALDALRTGVESRDQLSARAEAMLAHYDALEAVTNRWCDVQNMPAEGKANGVHKSRVLDAWLDACRTLSRDIAEALRELK